MFTFRALGTGTDTVYYGLPHRVYKENTVDSMLLDDGTVEYIKPETLGVTYSGLTDKNGEQIYASFEIDGRMTKGGDIIETMDFDEIAVKFKNYSFNTYDVNFHSTEIIGKQWEDNND